MPRVLVIVPCGKAKVWNRRPDAGPCLAKDAYVGTPFKLNRAYAERFGDCWVVLSAKFGFIAPDFVIPGDYNVTFNRRSSERVDAATLDSQIREMRLTEFEVIVGLGGRQYREVVTAAFAPFDVSPVFPFAGLPLGKALQQTRRAIDAGDPGFVLPRC